MSQFARTKVQRPQAQQRTSTVSSPRGDLSRPSISSSFNKGLSNNSGQPLDAGTRAFMESRFGHDFSRVRVHTDSRAAESAQAINALAYTVGRNVVFGRGQYAPGTSEGSKLLAHELTHVVQTSSKISLSRAIVCESDLDVSVAV